MYDIGYIDIIIGLAFLKIQHRYRYCRYQQHKLVLDMYVLIVTNRIFSRYLMDVFESLNRGDDVIWVGEGDYCIG